MRSARTAAPKLRFFSVAVSSLATSLNINLHFAPELANIMSFMQ